MKAIYRGRLATITEVMGQATSPLSAADIRERHPGHFLSALPDEGMENAWRMDGVVLDQDLWVSFMDPELVVDPTDDQVEAAQ